MGEGGVASGVFAPGRQSALGGEVNVLNGTKTTAPNKKEIQWTMLIF